MYSTRYFCEILMTLEFSRHIFEKYPDMEFHENPPQWEPRCSTLTEGQTDTTKLIAAFGNFAKAPKSDVKINTLRYVSKRAIVSLMVLSCSSVNTSVGRNIKGLLPGVL
jgi:hypothetical protein